MSTIFAGTPLVATVTGGSQLGFPGGSLNGIYVPGDIFADGAVDVSGFVRGSTLFVDQWYDNTPTNMNGVNVTLMTNAQHDVPSGNSSPFTHTGGGIFRANYNFDGTVDFVTTASTANTQVTIQFVLNSNPIRTFYNTYIPGVTNVMPISCSRGITFTPGDFFSIITNGVTGADPINTAADDSNGWAQTILTFTGITL